MVVFLYFYYILFEINKKGSYYLDNISFDFSEF